MQVTPKVLDEDIRPIDPNVKQWAASNPMQHVWVSASAGTGKTKVLTDRVLRLMLPRENGQPATPPHKILCLTYTKAAAGEMMLRINERLGKWVVMSDEDLSESLRKTTGQKPDQDTMNAARQLFTKVVDTPGGLKIMTIHAFCQSILGRFPLEAGVLPQMDVLDEATASEMMLQALKDSIQDGRYYEIYARLSAELAESTLIDRIKDSARDRDQLSHFFKNYQTPETQLAALKKTLNAPQESEEEVLQSFIKRLEGFELQKFAGALASGAKTDIAKGDVLYSWLRKETHERQKCFADFRGVFLKSDGMPYKKLTKGTIDAWEGAEDFHVMMAAMIMEVEDQIKAIQLSHLTHDLLVLSQKVISTYRTYKDEKGFLDYDDLIIKTHDLLQYAQKAVPWILYKLDGGLDHILVDEAQDTNPLQWKIIALLVEEFFNKQEDIVRTLFVVGDEKQSIYRFQGAALEEFQYRRFFFEAKAKTGGTDWHNENLMTSFRSTRSVLEFVDAAFKDDQMRHDIGVPESEELEHISWRRKQAGKVSLWPLIEPQEKEKRTPWELPLEIKESRTPKALLASEIADQIEAWMTEKRILPSKNRPVRAGDIMVLVRSRDAFVEHLMKALKARFIPVSGADRLILNNHIAVKDMISLAKFALQPRDDLALAEILRSPFIGIGEQELEDLSYGREDVPLWHRVRKNIGADILAWLEGLQQSIHLPPFQFFFKALNMPCPQDSVSGLKAMQKRLGHDFLDIIDEFLSAVQTYQYEQSKMLQSFIVWQSNNPIEIKREFDGQEDAVKIMTVHGAKGLQAPIVFLPDTLRSGTSVQTKVPRYIMPGRSEAEMPIWSPRQSYDCQAYKAYFDKIVAQENAEYKRLFYVAATRAEDELIICGAASQHKAHEESWYYYARHAFDHLRQSDVENTDGRLSFAYPQTGDAEEEESAEELQNNKASLPEWAFKPAPAEPKPPRPFRPSRPSEDEPALLSPYKDDGQARFKRGLLTHTLLQFLPNLEQGQRESAGRNYLATHAQGFSADICEDILHEALRVMSSSEFADIFSPQAQAEVSLSGHLPSGRLISGQVDRLLVRDQDVLIIDYKTNRPQPIDQKDVPKIYFDQMRAYKQALEKIYPDKKVRCALLWTYGPLLMELDDL